MGMIRTNDGRVIVAVLHGRKGAAQIRKGT